MKTKNPKSITINFPPRIENAKDNLPLQYKAEDIAENGPVGFYRNINTVFNGIVFRDVQGNLTYFDTTLGIISAFDREAWTGDMFIYQPQLTCLHIKCDAKISTVNKCK